jgi:N-acetylglucosaminyldiphosphoundecaprenol N-acetyl-beta-D-mannosaminyltransferase
MMDRQSVEILGVRVCAIDQEGLVDQVITWVRHGEKRTLTYANAHCLNLAVEDASYRELLSQTDLVYVDGIGAVWAGKLFGCRDLRKVTGRKWIEALCRKGEDETLRLYLLGGKPGIAEQASKVLEQRYPRLHICGSADGFFHTKTETQVLAEINNTHPQVLLVGMGVPNQEWWVALNRAKIQTDICWSAGALFDYLAGVEEPVPSWLERIGLEWAWRLKEDPKGKWKRYMIGIPRFTIRVIADRWNKGKYA